MWFCSMVIWHLNSNGLGKQIVEWLRGRATYAADLGWNPSQSFAACHTPSLFHFLSMHCQIKVFKKKKNLNK